MASRSSRAGGIFITIGALAGFAWGAATGRATLGVIIGTALGFIALAALWLLDWRRPR